MNYIKSNDMSEQHTSSTESENTALSKRKSLKMMLSASALTIWHKPIVNAVVLPAHAQTSVVDGTIRVSSLDSDNPFARYILIVDSNDRVLANCGASGGVATATGLSAGTYRIFADSDGVRTQVMDISTSTVSRRITVQLATGNCDFLVATVELPSGRIVRESGARQAGSWSCSSSQNLNCTTSKRNRSY